MHIVVVVRRTAINGQARISKVPADLAWTDGESVSNTDSASAVAELNGKPIPHRPHMACSKRGGRAASEIRRAATPRTSESMAHADVIFIFTLRGQRSHPPAIAVCPLRLPSHQQHWQLAMFTRAARCRLGPLAASPHPVRPVVVAPLRQLHGLRTARPRLATPLLSPLLARSYNNDFRTRLRQEVQSGGLRRNAVTVTAFTIM